MTENNYESLEPRYEIWGGWLDDASFGIPPEFFEDVWTFEEAKKAVKEYQKNGNRYAMILDKNTGFHV